MPAQTIDNGSGEKLVVLPENEYNDLLRVAKGEVTDLKQVASLNGTIDLSSEEMLPSEMVEEMVLAGESRLKAWREVRGLSIPELAKMADVADVTIYKIQSGEGHGKVPVLRAIAKALDIGLDDFVPVFPDP